MNDLYSPSFWIQVALAIIGVGTLIVLKETLRYVGRQADAAHQQTGIMNRQFLASQRPRLVVRRVFVPLEYKTEIKGHFDVANVGTGDAIIEDAHAEFFIENELPAVRPYDGVVTGNLRPETEMIIGMGIERRFSVSPTTLDVRGYINLNNSLELEKPGPPFVYVMGYIGYKDQLGNFRRTTFCRQHDSATKRFIKVPDEDYESSD